MTIANLEKLCRLIKNNNDNLPSQPLPPIKFKVFSRRKSHLTTAVIFLAHCHEEIEEQPWRKVSYRFFFLF